MNDTPPVVKTHDKATNVYASVRVWSEREFCYVDYVLHGDLTVEQAQTLHEPPLVIVLGVRVL